MLLLRIGGHMNIASGIRERLLGRRPELMLARRWSSLLAAKRGRPELQKMRIGGRGVKTATQMHERAQGHEGK